jgi:hypothetical protein
MDAPMSDDPSEGRPSVPPVDPSGEHVTAEIPGSSGHHPPGSRSRAVDEALDAEPLRRARRVTVVAPLGDVEALERIRERLHPQQERAAGASVVVDAEMPAEPPPGTGGSSATSTDD